MTDEYIRRQEMLDAVDHLHIIPSIDGTGKPTPTDDFRVQFLGTVLRVPSADVVQVVRCKDCKHYYFADNRIPQEQRYVCEISGEIWKPDSFCSYGERKG